MAAWTISVLFQLITGCKGIKKFNSSEIVYSGIRMSIEKSVSKFGKALMKVAIIGQNGHRNGVITIHVKFAK